MKLDVIMAFVEARKERIRLDKLLSGTYDNKLLNKRIRAGEKELDLGAALDAHLAEEIERESSTG